MMQKAPLFASLPTYTYQDSSDVADFIRVIQTKIVTYHGLLVKILRAFPFYVADQTSNKKQRGRLKRDF